MQDSKLICLWQLFLLRASAEFEQAQLRIRLGVGSKLGFDLIKPHYLRLGGSRDYVRAPAIWAGFTVFGLRPKSMVAKENCES